MKLPKPRYNLSNSMKSLMKRQSGDTIIEVLLSIAILGIVMAGAYGLANRNLNSGQSAEKRNQALASAQGQIQFIIDAQNNGAASIDRYKNFTGDFCILPNGDPKAKDSAECKAYNGQPYSLIVHYTSSLFTVTANWTTQNAANPEKLTLYYKLVGTYSGPGAVTLPPIAEPPIVAGGGGGPTFKPGTGNELPTYDIRVQPYTTEGQDPTKCYNYYWLYFDSPNTSRHFRVSGPGSKDEWWTLHSFMVPSASDWPADNWGNSIYNWHNAADDAGSTGDGGIGWGFGSGVSAVHVLFKSLHFSASDPSNTGLIFHVEYANYNKNLPDVVPGQWYDIVTHIVYGRTDGTTPRAGSAQVWVNGNSTPVVNLSNIDTLQKAVNPDDGKTYVQQVIDYWDGGPYRKGEPCRRIGPQASRHVVTATRFGTTLDKAINDTKITLTGGGGSVHVPGLPDYGDSTATQVIPGRQTGDFKLPSGL